VKKRKTWEPLTTDQGTRQAAQRYATRNSLPWPPH
jgi:hypothetical protein